MREGERDSERGMEITRARERERKRERERCPSGLASSPPPMQWEGHIEVVVVRAGWGGGAGAVQPVSPLSIGALLSSQLARRLSALKRLSLCGSTAVRARSTTPSGSHLTGAARRSPAGRTAGGRGGAGGHASGRSGEASGFKGRNEERQSKNKINNYLCLYHGG